jgi:hypothetical protein
MDIAAPLAELQGLANSHKAAEMLAYHKVDRPYLGVPVPDIEVLTDRWRAELSLDDRIALAAGLWQANIHEARIAAAKLLTQARIRPDDAAWALIQSWVPEFDAWAIADHASIAGQKRLVADPSRIDAVEPWVQSPQMWTRRAALVMTLPWTKQNFPKAQDLAIRARVLGWCADLASDPTGSSRRPWPGGCAICQSISRATRAFLDQHGVRLKPFARKEAARLLPDGA